MAIRNILVPLAPEQTADQTMAVAIGLAQKFSAHISGLYVRPDPSAPVPYVVGPMPTEMLVQISENTEKQGKRRSARAKAQFRDICKKHKVPIRETLKDGEITASWKEAVGNIDFLYGVEARLCDVAVLAQPASTGVDSLEDVLEGVMFQSGRPALMLPAGTTDTPGNRIVIGWNGSLEATRAVAASLPFLTAAREVTILTIGEQTADGPSGNDLRKYLALHGVKAKVVLEELTDGVESRHLLAKSRALKADMIVMGAYSHSRLRELILGGVTHEVIDQSDIPVLLVH